MARVRDDVLDRDQKESSMNLDRHLLDVVVCPACRAVARRRRRQPRSWSASGAAWPTRCATTSPCSWSTRRASRSDRRNHPPRAPARCTRMRHACTETALPGEVAMTFDDGLLDDEVALRRADQRLRYLAEGGARVRREAVASQDAAAEAVQRLSEGQPGRWSLPVRTPDCFAPCWSRSVRCPSSPGPVRVCPDGQAASTWWSCWRPRAGTPATAARSPRPYDAGARSSWPPRRSPWSRSTRRAATRRCCPPRPATSWRSRWSCSTCSTGSTSAPRPTRT